MHVVIIWYADMPVVVQVLSLHLALYGTQKKSEEKKQTSFLAFYHLFVV